jgi:hypothetical protein
MFHSTYEINGHHEYMLRAVSSAGSGDGSESGLGNTARHILIVPPLFDEMNRMRRVLVSAMRELAVAGISSSLPDLPGCNESIAKLADQDLDIWRGAITAAAQQSGASHIASIRGGTLIDDGPAALPHWRLSPVKGGSLLKTMLRTRIASDKEAGVITSMDSLLELGSCAPIELAGNMLSPAMLASLNDAEAAMIPNAVTATLGDGPGDVKGSAIWMRAEPQDDPQMAASIASQLDHWSSACGQ